MSTSTSSVSRVSRARRFRPDGRPVGRAAALAVPLLAAGALAAGCASTQSAAPAAKASVLPAVSATAASASATPVPTTSGGRVVPGEPACTGWPAGAKSVSLPVSFVPVSVERCQNGAETIRGKGLWETATLERSDSGLAGLVSALRQPSTTRHPGTVCPALAIIPPQVLLIGANGEKLIPRLPATGCGLVQSQVLAALDALHWQTVSVRLIAQISSPQATASGSSPRSIQTVGGAQQ